MESLRRDARLGRPLRLLWLIDSLAMGGAERLAASFAREATRAGIDLCVCCLKRINGNPVEAELRAAGVRCERLDAAHLRDRRAFGRLRRLLREGRFDIVHAHLTYATLWGLVTARLSRVPCVVTLHVNPSEDPPWSREKIRERLMCALVTRLNATAIAVSAALRDRYLRAGLLDPSRVVVVPNGVETERFPAANPGPAARLRAEFALPADAQVLMTMAVLRDRRKGLHVLLDAFPRLLASCPAAWLIVVGDGPLKPELLAQAQQLGVADKICWAGMRSDVPSLLAGADVFVHPALEDAFPTAILEAMAAALPIVASDADGIPEMIANGTNGRLVPASNPPALATALTELLGDARSRDALGAAARRTVVEHFSTPVWVRALRDVYERELEARSVPVPGAAVRSAS